MQKMIEHEPMIRTTKGMIPQSCLHAVNETAKNQTPPPDLGPVKLDKTCPLKGRMYDARCPVYPRCGVWYQGAAHGDRGGLSLPRYGPLWQELRPL